MPLLSTLTEKIDAQLAGTEQTYLSDTGTDKRTALSSILYYIKANFGAVFNKVTITAPASSATLTIANGKTLTINSTVTLAGTDGTTITLPGATSTLASIAGTETLTNKTLTSPTLTTPVIGAATGTSLALSGAATAATASATGTIAAQSATATPAPASMVAAFAMGSAGIGIFWGSGAPTGSAAKGSLYINTSGSAGAGSSDRLYINTTGSTVWTAITTAA